MGIPRPKLTIGQQMTRMQEDFPGFQYKRANGIPTWIGRLQPFEQSPIYTVKFIYPVPKRPRIHIIDPPINDKAPHLYPDSSLCLYFPKDASWSPGKFLSQTIVPWTSLWLAFYELWSKTGIWYGPEAPHKTRKR